MGECFVMSSMWAHGDELYVSSWRSALSWALCELMGECFVLSSMWAHGGVLCLELYVSSWRSALSSSMWAHGGVLCLELCKLMGECFLLSSMWALQMAVFWSFFGCWFFVLFCSTCISLLLFFFLQQNYYFSFFFLSKKQNKNKTNRSCSIQKWFFSDTSVYIFVEEEETNTLLSQSRALSVRIKQHILLP